MELLQEYFGQDMNADLQRAIIQVADAWERRSDAELNGQQFDQASFTTKIEAAFQQYHLERSAMIFADDLGDGHITL